MDETGSSYVWSRLVIPVPSCSAVVLIDFMAHPDGSHFYSSGYPGSV